MGGTTRDGFGGTPKGSPLDRLPGLSPGQRALLADRLRSAADARTLVALPRQSRTPEFPLSSVQRRMWFGRKADPGHPSHNVPLICRLDGPLDRDALGHAVDEFVARHEVMRIRVLDDGEHPRQRVQPPRASTLVQVDLSGAPEPEQAATDLIAELSAHPLDLTTSAPILARLLKLADDRHVLLLLLDHIVTDAVAQSVLWRELSQLYRAHVTGGPNGLDSPALQYGDFAAWEIDQRDSPKLRRQLDYWSRQLAGMTELALPTDRPRPAVRSVAGAQFVADYDAGLAELLARHCQRAGVGGFNVLLAAIVVVLGRWAGQHDVAVGSLLSGRTRRDTNELLGPLINTVVLRVDTGGDPSFDTMLDRVSQVVLGALDNQEPPFEWVAEDVDLVHASDRHPLIQTLFQVDSTTAAQMQLLALDGVAVTPVAPVSTTADLDLVIGVTFGPDNLRMIVDFSTALFDRDTVSWLTAEFGMLLRAVLEHPDLPMSVVLADR